MDEEKKKQGLEDDRVNAWQNRLMPWLILMPTALVAAFIILATLQASKFNRLMLTSPDHAFVNDLLQNSPDTLRNKLEFVKWVSLVRMEQESYFKRYNQAGFLLMSRVFTKYLGFFTGMILAIVGSVFIIGKIKEDTTDLEGNISEKTRFKIVSSSPGIIFGVLGTLLMMATILQHSEIEVRDRALYLKSPIEISTSQDAPAGTIEIDPEKFNQLFTEPEATP